ncbi:MAG: hypothetical protein ACFFE8_03095 [Candidatus Heimdallarchaeota archaeon]
MRTSKKSNILQVFFVIILLGIVSGTKVAAFTLEDFWEEDAKLNYAVRTTGDYEDEFFDNEYRLEGTYVYDGKNEEGKVTFNISESNVFVEDATVLGLGFFVRIGYPLQAGDSIEYFFEVAPLTTEGPISIDFFIFTKEEYSLWENPATHLQAQAVYTSSSSFTDEDVFNATISETYYLVWHNDQETNADSVYIHFVLDADISRHPNVGTITIDPITLETEEGSKIDEFAMDTTGWKMGDKVTIEINDRPVDFTIVDEEELPLPINNVSENIPTWVLEKIGYERTYLEQETITINADYKIWKSKHSGTTLQSTEDIDLYDNNSTLVTTSFSKFAITSIENVTIKPRITNFYLFPIAAGIMVLIAYRKSKKD